jgi:CBS domain-containing protein
VNQKLANLASQFAELLLGKVLQISGPADLFQHPVSLRSDPRLPESAASLAVDRSAITVQTYRRTMRAEQIAEEFPVVSIDADALEAARMLAQHSLPGLLVTDTSGIPYAVLPASQVVRFIVPRYVQDDPSLAGVLNESMADRCAEKLRGKKVGDVLPDHLVDVPPANADDTIIEVAALMARLRSPLVAVVKDGRLIGVITASRVLGAALQP